MFLKQILRIHNPVKAKRQASVITLNFSESSGTARLTEFKSSVGFSSMWIETEIIHWGWPICLLNYFLKISEHRKLTAVPFPRKRMRFAHTECAHRGLSTDSKSDKGTNLFDLKVSCRFLPQNSITESFTFSCFFKELYRPARELLISAT